MAREYRTGTGVMRNDVAPRVDGDDLLDEDAAQARSLARLDEIWQRPTWAAEPEPVETAEADRVDGDDLPDEQAAAKRSLARLDRAWKSPPREDEGMTKEQVMNEMGMPS